MSRNSHRRCSIKKAVLKNIAIFIRNYLHWTLFSTELFQHSCFPVNIAKFLRTPSLKNIYEWLLLNVVFNSNEEQHLRAKLDEMVQDKIIFYIYSYHFGIIISVFYPEAVVRGCSLKRCF